MVSYRVSPLPILSVDVRDRFASSFMGSLGNSLKRAFCTERSVSKETEAVIR